MDDLTKASAPKAKGACTVRAINGLMHLFTPDNRFIPGLTDLVIIQPLHGLTVASFTMFFNSKHLSTPEQPIRHFGKGDWCYIALVEGKPRLYMFDGKELPKITKLSYTVEKESLSQAKVRMYVNVEDTTPPSRFSLDGILNAIRSTPREVY